MLCSTPIRLNTTLRGERRRLAAAYRWRCSSEVLEARAFDSDLSGILVRMTEARGEAAVIILLRRCSLDQRARIVELAAGEPAPTRS